MALHLPQVLADYWIGYAVNSFEHSPNTLFDDTCCVRGNGSRCAGACNPVFSVCFRESHHLLPDNDLEECKADINGQEGRSEVMDDYYSVSSIITNSS